MNIVKLTSRLSNEERETVLVYDNIDKKWHMDTLVVKHYTKAKKQGWVQLTEYQYEDGTIVGGRFEAPARAITIRSTEKKVLSDKQLRNLTENCE